MSERNQSSSILENVTNKAQNLSSWPSKCLISTRTNAPLSKNFYQILLFLNLSINTSIKSKKFAGNLSLMKLMKIQNSHYKSIEVSFTRILKEDTLSLMMPVESRALLQFITRNISHWWRKTRKSKSLRIITTLLLLPNLYPKLHKTQVAHLGLKSQF